MRRKNRSKSDKTDAARERFVRDVLTRGEAVKPAAEGLPSGATHEIVKDDGKKLPTIRRRRFSIA